MTRILFLNCSLKKTPEVSNTSALIAKIKDLYEEKGLEAEEVRVADYNIEHGITSDEGNEDEWPKLLKKIKACNILIIGTPIWFGVRSSITQKIIERLSGTYSEADEETGQFPLYNKVAGIVVTGNEDGAHNAAAHTLYNLTHLGCAIPPNADCYWVGEAGPGPSYIKADGGKHMYTNKTARYLVENTIQLAEILKKNPITTNLKECDKQAKKISHE